MMGLLIGSGCEAVYGPTSPSAEWAASESPRYILNARPGSFCESQAAALAEVLEEQYSHTVGALQIEIGGLASALVSEHFGDIGPASLHRWVRNNPTRVMAIADLVDDTKWNSNSNDGYRSSASFLAFLIERYGAARLKLVYHARSSQLPARMQEVYGVALETLEAEWRSALR